MRFLSATRPICHCRSAEEARELWRALADRFAACKLVLHPEKTKIVYCKDANRRGDFPVIAFDFLGFQFRARKTMWRKGERRIFAHDFQPAASPKALTRISWTVRRWALHHRSDKSLTELAAMYNPCIRGWITYYSHFYKTQLRPTLTGSMPMSLGGHAASSSGCAIGPRGHETGLTGSAGRTRISSPTGSYAMATAEHREPYDARVSLYGCCVQQRLVCSAGDKPAGAKVRSPVVRIAGWRETKILKPIDEVSLGEITSHRAVTTVNVNVASKMKRSEGRARIRRAKAA